MADSYKAFLSYASPDRALAVRLHRKLERLARRHWWQPRARRVFLDLESTIPSDDLWAKVENALRHSEFLVVLASPHSAASPWVQLEVEWWLQHKGIDTLLIALASGHIHWDRSTRDFTQASSDAPTDALPAALRGAFDREPEWVLVAGGRPSRAADQADLTDAAAAIVAALERVAKDQVLKRDVRQRRRVWFGATTLVAVALAGLTAAYFQWQRASREADDALALNLANEAEVAMSQPHLIERGALLALESVRRSHLPQNDAVLRRALTLLPRPVAAPRHPLRVFSVAVAHSGRLFATGGGDGVTRVFRLPEVELVAEGRQTAQVFELTFSPDDRMVVSASGDGSVRAFDIASGQQRWVAPTTGRAIAIAASPDGQFVAAGTDQHEVTVFAASSGRTIWRQMADGYVESVAFSPDSRLLAAAGGGSLHVFAASTGTVIRRGQEAARALAFSPDGRRLAVVSDTVSVLRVGTWTEEASFKPGHPQGQVAFAGDSNRLASTGTDGLVHVWDAGERRELTTFSLNLQVVPMWVTFSPDGQSVASGWWDKTARVFDAATGVEQWRVVHDGFVLAGRFTPDGRRLITGGDDGIARVSERPNASTVAMYGRPYLSVPLVISADGRHLAAVREDRKLRLVERYSGATLAEWSIDGQTTALQFLPEGRHVVMAVQGKDVRVVEATSGRMVWQVPVEAQVDGLAVSPHGTAVAVASWDGQLRALDATSGATVWAADLGQTLLGAAFSGDGSRVAFSGVPAESRVFDASNGAVVWRRTIGGTSATALSHDGAMVAFALADQSVRVYELADDREIFRAPTQGTVVALAFSADGRYLVMGGDARIARVFDLHDGSERVRIPHDGELWTVAFTADGRLFTNQGFNVLRWHPVAADALIADVCTHLSRSLTTDEWARYLGDLPYRPQCDAHR